MLGPTSKQTDIHDIVLPLLQTSSPHYLMWPLVLFDVSITIRCDVSIAKLSGDSRKISEAVATFNKQIQENNAHHVKIAGELEAKVIFHIDP